MNLRSNILLFLSPIIIAVAYLGISEAYVREAPYRAYKAVFANPENLITETTRQYNSMSTLFDGLFGSDNRTHGNRYVAEVSGRYVGQTPKLTGSLRSVGSVDPELVWNFTNEQDITGYDNRCYWILQTPSYKFWHLQSSDVHIHLFINEVSSSFCLFYREL